MKKLANYTHPPKNKYIDKYCRRHIRNFTLHTRVKQISGTIETNKRELKLFIEKFVTKIGPMSTEN